MRLEYLLIVCFLFIWLFIGFMIVSVRFKMVRMENEIRYLKKVLERERMMNKKALNPSYPSYPSKRERVG